MSKEVPHVTSAQLQKDYESYSKKYNIISIEDPYDQDDWEGYANLTASLGKDHQIVGDDLLVTNQKRIASAINSKACNALLLKVNQIGTITESIQSYEMSRGQWMGSHGVTQIRIN